MQTFSGSQWQYPRRLYFHSLASLSESWIPTATLKNANISSNKIALKPFVSTSVPDARAGQSTVEVMTDDGILVYALPSQNALACWNSANPFVKQTQSVIYTVRVYSLVVSFHDTVLILVHLRLGCRQSSIRIGFEIKRQRFVSGFVQITELRKCGS